MKGPNKITVCLASSVVHWSATFHCVDLNALLGPSGPLVRYISWCGLECPPGTQTNDKNLKRKHKQPNGLFG